VIDYHVKLDGTAKKDLMAALKERAGKKVVASKNPSQCN